MGRGPGGSAANAGKTAWDSEGIVVSTSIPQCFAGERKLPVSSMEGPQFVFPSGPHFRPGLVTSWLINEVGEQKACTHH